MNSQKNNLAPETNDIPSFGLELKHVGVGSNLVLIKMSKEVISGIYKITSPSGKIYIGQSIDIYTAWNHRYKNGHCNGQTKLYATLKKYGFKNLLFEIIHTCCDEKFALDYWEIFYIKYYNCKSPNGLNLKDGGTHGRHSEETKKKMSISNKIAHGTPEMKEKQRQRALGRTHSEESKAKMSLIHTGFKHSQESLLKMSNSFKGRKYPNRKSWSEEDRRKQAIRHTGKKMSPEAIEKTRQANIGKVCKEETRDKISKTLTGRSLPIETKQKLSKIILDTSTGIFYIGVKEAAYVLNKSEVAMSRRLNGYLKNNTSFVYA